MRRLIVGIVVAAAALVPIGATAGNQQVAEQIAATLRDSGQLRGYRIGVKYQDGTAWLKGEVATREEMATALELVFNVPGVTRVTNHLTVRSEQPKQVASQPEQTPPPLQEAHGAVSGEARAPSFASDKSHPNASQVVRSQIDRLTMRATSVDESLVETAGLEEPASAAKEPVTVPVKTKRPEKPVLAPVRAKADSRVERTGLEEPTVAPKPMPAAYAQPPLPMARVNGAAMPQAPMAIPTGAAPARYDQPNLPNYAWPSYAAYPNYAALTYPKQYSPTAWPYIGPFYPYPQVPLGWRKVTLEWHDGWWALDFDDGTAKGPFSGLYRPARRRY
jgi:hypothetical protein